MVPICKKLNQTFISVHNPIKLQKQALNLVSDYRIIYLNHFTKIYIEWQKHFQTKDVSNQVSPINIRNMLNAGWEKGRKPTTIKKLKELHRITKIENFHKNSFSKFDNTEE